MCVDIYIYIHLHKVLGCTLLMETQMEQNMKMKWNLG